jgi:hypothetical protein
MATYAELEARLDEVQDDLRYSLWSSALSVEVRVGVGELDIRIEGVDLEQSAYIAETLRDALVGALLEVA